MLELRKWENIHIPLWLIKDTCWMMEWRWLGVCMIFPTVLTAIYLTKKTIGHSEFFINLAICFWISANSFWMCAEFFDFAQYKDYAAIPFALGMIAVSIFYLKRPKETSN